MELHRDLLESILDTVGALVVALDREGRVVLFNRACEVATGFTEAEVRGEPLWQRLLVPEEVEPVKKVFAELSAGTYPNRFENYWVTREGRRRRIAWSNTAITDVDGQVALVIGTGIDVTGEREAQDRARAAEHLASIATLGASIVHEIKNPLNAATLQLQLMDRRLSTAAPDVPGARRAGELVAQELARVTRLLEEFLLFARPKPLERTPVDLQRLVGDVVEYCRPQALAAGVSLRVDPQAPLVAPVDEAKLRQVLLNLVLNAVQASPKGASVSVSARKVGAAAELRVEDHGPGLAAPPEKLFEPFFTTKAGGTGLGLAVARHIVLDHGGELTAQSEPGRTVFSVRLPL